MIRGIRRVVQHLGIFGGEDLRDYEQSLREGIPDDELRTLLDDAEYDGGGDFG